MGMSDLLKALKTWVELLGPDEAARRLANVTTAKLSLSLIDKLVRGAYARTLSFDKANAIITEMAKDGISLADEAAS